jgi:hypothetical protein
MMIKLFCATNVIRNYRTAAEIDINRWRFGKKTLLLHPQSKGGAFAMHQVFRFVTKIKVNEARDTRSRFHI